MLPDDFWAKITKFKRTRTIEAYNYMGEYSLGDLKISKKCMNVDAQNNKAVFDLGTISLIVQLNQENQLIIEQLEGKKQVMGSKRRIVTSSYCAEYEIIKGAFFQGTILSKCYNWEYKGTMTRKGEMHKEGTLTHADGRVYHGYFQWDVMRGLGEYRYADGSAYRGMHYDGKHGLGVYTKPDGEIIWGVWSNIRNLHGISQDCPDEDPYASEELNEAKFRKRCKDFIPEKDYQLPTGEPPFQWAPRITPEELVGYCFP